MIPFPRRSLWTSRGRDKQSSHQGVQESVPGKQPARLTLARIRDDSSGLRTRYLRRHVETYAALRVTRRVQHLRFVASPAYSVTLAQQFADFNLFWRLPANPSSLHVQHAIKLQIVGMHSNGRAGLFLESAKSPYVIDMRMRDDDRGYTQFVAMNDFEDSLRVIAGINDQSFERFWVADNMAIALQYSDRQDFMNDFVCFGHECKYSIGRRGNQRGQSKMRAWTFGLLVAKRFDGIEAGGFPGWIISKKYSYTRGKHKGDENRRERDSRRPLQ